MLGRYLLAALREDNDVTTLQRHDADIICDLASNVPDLRGRHFDLVVHAAGTTDDNAAVVTNYEGTRHLLEALASDPPARLVLVSSWEVYSPESGEDVGEEYQKWASTKTGQSKALAEDLAAGWCREHGVLLTVVRPARMMGKGVGGEMLRMFNDVAYGRYIHVRDNDARLSLVCASDVALAIKRLHSIGGIYNLTDGRGARWIELADAMSANLGAMKRQTHLPARWADLAWRYASWIPAVKASLSPATLARRSTTLTLSDAAVRAALSDWKPYPVLEVIGRECEDYPYLDQF